MFYIGANFNNHLINKWLKMTILSIEPKYESTIYPSTSIQPVTTNITQNLPNFFLAKYRTSNVGIAAYLKWESTNIIHALEHQPLII